MYAQVMIHDSHFVYSLFFLELLPLRLLSSFHCHIMYILLACGPCLSLYTSTKDVLHANFGEGGLL